MVELMIGQLLLKTIRSRTSLKARVARVAIVFLPYSSAKTLGRARFRSCFDTTSKAEPDSYLRIVGHITVRFRVIRSSLCLIAIYGEFRTSRWIDLHVFVTRLNSQQATLFTSYTGTGSMDVV